MSVVDRSLLCAGLFGALVLGAAPAWAQSTQPQKDPYILDEDKMFDVQLFRNMLGTLGLREEDKGIEYRERSPLVIPPVTALPPPVDTTIKSANWPVDPEVKARREIKAAHQKAAQGDSVMEDARVLRPDELERGRNVAMKKGRGGVLSGEESWRASRPDELGGPSLFGLLKPQKEEDNKKFTGEPARTTLVEPPTGYQTPSPAQPYGLSKSTRTQQQAPQNYYDNYGTYEGR